MDTASKRDTAYDIPDFGPTKGESMQLAAETFARVLLILGVSGVASVSLAALMSYLRDRGDRGGN